MEEILKKEEESIENGAANLSDIKHIGPILYKKFNHQESGNYGNNRFVKCYVIDDNKAYVLIDHVKCGSYGTQDRRNYVLVADNTLKITGETSEKQYFLTEDIGNPQWKMDSVPVKHTMDNPHFVKILEITDHGVKLEDDKGGDGELNFPKN